jgi:hypothetical protein
VSLVNNINKESTKSKSGYVGIDWSKIINKYGGICVCCGESNIKFLTLDHKNGMGRKQKRKDGLRNQNEFYRWIIENNFPDILQVLCWNCNCSRHYFNGLCPHREKYE